MFPRIPFTRLFPLLAVIMPAPGGSPMALHAGEPVKFSRDVLPILSENCLSCHGPDESNRKADLRLDKRDAAIAARNGTAAITPGRPQESELMRRVLSADPDEVMPTPKSHKQPLKLSQIETLKQWIAEGAPWGNHWAFEVPQRAPSPDREAHPVDAFIRKTLKKEGLPEGPPAKPHTLLRRVTFDLTGLPPTQSELDLFLNDSTSDAWSRAVDRLLASPHFGERMAMWWLDVARYADTDGFQSDSTRSNWPWRDWVVQSFNANKRFDEFTVEQFAGDLLPNPSAEQRMATCFHRNHMTNGEGGRDPEESRVDYVIDRVNTMGTTWLGLTLGCTQCHSHKFDPISQKEYYSLSAFFNSIDETGAAGSGAKPFLEYKAPQASDAVAQSELVVEESKSAERAARLQAEGHFKEALPKLIAASRSNYQEWRPLQPETLASAEGTILTAEPGGIVQASGPNPFQDEYRFGARPGLRRITGIKLEVLPHASHTDGGLSRGKTGEFILTDLKVQVGQKGKSELRDIKLAGAVADFSADKKANGGYGDIKDTLDDDPRNGWTTKGAAQTQKHTAVFRLSDPLELNQDEILVVELKQRATLGDTNLGRFQLSATDEAGATVSSVNAGPMKELSEIGADSPEQVDEALRKKLFEQYLEDFEPYKQVRGRLTRANNQLSEAKSAAGNLKVMVMAERKEPRETFVLLRGVWDKHGEKVTEGVPAAISAWPEKEPKNRLGLARWMTARENPLTARVIVNQIWQLLFGAGLVRTPEDFGLQGEQPTHPELLDWLAVEFMESGWDVKQLFKLITTSDAYRRSSVVSAELLARDPENRLLARGARFRLPSWMLRDAALQYSGLLTASLGGAPVRPYQPSGVWEELFMGRFNYEPSLGAAQYRRTLYAFWRRSIAPTFLFDTAQRRICEVRVNRTNTPLQALTLMNDETYREASRVLAGRAIQQSSDSRTRIKWLFHTVLSRQPNENEWPPLLRVLDSASAHYANNIQDALSFLQCGQSPLPKDSQLSDTAAYSVLASLLLNLDEAITHE